MSLWLDTRGKTSLAIAICDRCKMKASVTDMVPDPNSPGVYAHAYCIDQYDPWRLPPRETEDITVSHPRPDLPLSAPTVMPGDPGWPIVE